MALPPSRKTQVLIDGTWRTMTTDVRYAAGVSIPNRGRPNELSQPTATRCVFTLNNSSGDYSDQNPLGQYYGLIGRNTQARQGFELGTDTFTRVASNSWGANDSGYTYALTGTDANFDVAAGVGTIVGGDFRTATFGTFAGVDILVKLKVNSRTDSPDLGVVANFQDTSNHYRFAIRVNDGGTDELIITKVTADVVTSSADLPSNVIADTWYWLRVRTGRLLRARIWADGAAEPTTWGITWLDNDPQFAQAPLVGAIGCYTHFGNGSTLVSFDSLEANHWRFHGEVPAWPGEWDITGRDVIAPLEAVGLLERMTKGQRALASPVFREAMRTTNVSSMVAYWPGEDDAFATQLGSALSGPAMRVATGSVSFASSSAFPGSASCISFGSAPTAVLHGRAARRAGGTTIKFRALMTFPDAGVPSTQRIADVYTVKGSGTIRCWRLLVTAAGALQLQGLDSTFAVVEDSGAAAFGVNGQTAMLGFEVTEDGADVDWEMATHYVNDDLTVSSGVSSGTFTVQTIGQFDEIYIGPDAGLTGCTIEHIAVGTSSAMMDGLEQAIVGYARETAIERIERLADEEGVSVSIIQARLEESASGGKVTELVGPQRTAPLIELFLDVAKADGGMLYEPRDEFGLIYRTKASLYDQDSVRPHAELDYNASHLTLPFRPVPDDTYVVNSTTVTRHMGSSSRYVKESGPLNVNNPEDDPEGIGLYERPETLNLAEDSRTADHAAWRVHRGTWPEARYPTVKVALHRDCFTSDLELAWAVAAMDLGDRLTVTGTRPDGMTDDIEQVIQGYNERWDGKTWEITFNTTPAGPYRVLQVGSDQFGKLDTAGCEVAASFTAGATSLLVNTTAEQYWTTTPGEYPFEIRCSGSNLTASACASGLTDAFGRVTAAGGWGTPLTSYPGTAYQVSGTAADFSTTGSVGRIATVTVNSLYLAHADSGCADGDLVISATVPVVPTGAAISLWLVGRLADANNYVTGHLSIATTGLPTLSVGERAGGALSLTASLTLPGLTHSAGDTWKIRVKWRGDEIRARAWKSTASEPAFWHVRTSVTLVSGTRIGAGVRRETGNTNGTQNIDYDNFELYNPQIFTVSATPANGVSKNLAAGDAVGLAHPVVLAL